jgi:hypothetical protein
MPTIIQYNQLTADALANHNATELCLEHGGSHEVWHICQAARKLASQGLALALSAPTAMRELTETSEVECYSPHRLD